jgi:hypothetical protein
MATTTEIKARPVAALKLWEISDGLRSIDDRLEETGGELTPELAADLDALELALESKAEGIAAIVSERRALAESVRAQARRLSDRAAAIERGADRLHAYLLQAMQAAARREIKTPAFTLRLAKNPASYQWLGETEDIPEEFRRVVVSFDASKAKAAHKAGEPLPELVAINQGEHLRIS